MSYTLFLRTLKMIGTLGEIPDKVTALQDLRRVLKQRGRVFIDEVLLDPDYVSPRALQEKAKGPGVYSWALTGPKFCYFCATPLCGGVAILIVCS